MIIITNLYHNIRSHCQFIKICHIKRIHTIQVQRIHHQIIIIKLYIILKHQHIMHSTIAITKSMWVPWCTHYQEILLKGQIIKLPQGLGREIHTQQDTKKMIEASIALTTQLLGRHNMLQILTHLTRQNQSLQEQNMYRGSNSNC